MYVNIFTVSQAAALSAGYDPASLTAIERFDPPEVAAAKQFIIAAILGGELVADSQTNALKKIGDYSRSLVSRSGLENLARSRSVFPAFLFDTIAPLAGATDQLLSYHPRQFVLARPEDQGVPLTRPQDQSVPSAFPPRPETSTQESVAPVVNRGGRPQEHDWDGFVLEIVRVANQPDGLPDTQAELVRTMLEWFGVRYGREPAESAVKARISKIYNYLAEAKNPD